MQHLKSYPKLVLSALFLLVACAVSAEPAAGVNDAAKAVSDAAPVAEPPVAEDANAESAAGSALPQGLADELSRLKPQKDAGGQSSGAGVVEMLVGLLAVLGVIVALAWLARRFNINGVSVTPSSLRLQSVLSLGTKEKVVIVNAEGRRFLLGVTPQQISVLSELDEVAEAANGESLPDNLSFAQQIKKALTQGKLGEHSKTS